MRPVTRRSAEHNTAGIRKRKGPHPLKGTLYCVCGRRFSTTLAKERYLYFFCLGRERCTEPTVAVADIERQIKVVFAGIRIPVERI